MELDTIDLDRIIVKLEKEASNTRESVLDSGNIENLESFNLVKGYYRGLRKAIVMLQEERDRYAGS